MDSSTYNVVLFFHLVGALLFVAGIVGDGAPTPIPMRFIASTELLWSSGRL